MVDSSSRLERKLYHPEPDSSRRILRCLRYRVRGMLNDKHKTFWTSSPRTLDERRTAVVNKHQRVGSGRKNNQSLLEVGETQRLCNTANDGQHCRNGLSQQDGGTMAASSRSGSKVAQGVRTAGSAFGSRTLTRSKEPWADTLSRLPKDRSDWRLDRRIFQLLERRTAHNRLVRHKGEYTTTQIRFVDGRLKVLVQSETCTRKKW